MSGPIFEREISVNCPTHGSLHTARWCSYYCDDGAPDGFNSKARQVARDHTRQNQECIVTIADDARQIEDTMPKPMKYIIVGPTMGIGEGRLYELIEDPKNPTRNINRPEYREVAKGPIGSINRLCAQLNKVHVTEDTP